MSEEPKTIAERIYRLLELERQRSGGYPPVLVMGVDVYLKLLLEMRPGFPASMYEGRMRKYMDRLIYIVPIKGFLQLGYEDWHAANTAAADKEASWAEPETTGTDATLATASEA